MAFGTSPFSRPNHRSLAGLGFNVIRAHSIGISSGMQSQGKALMPALNTVNTAAFASIDYAIYRAKSSGIRLVVPLTDNWCGLPAKDARWAHPLPDLSAFSSVRLCWVVPGL